jgi:PST family polysaccharide transporter
MKPEARPTARPVPESLLQTGHLQRDLRARSVSGAAVTLVAQWTKFALHLGSLYILARVLTPGDFGLVGMVTAATGLIALVKDLGLSTATIQREEIRHHQVSTLFWVNAGLSTGIALLTAAAAPALARFYREPRLTGITVALACAIVLGGLALQHQALLSRQMRFSTLAGVEIVSQAIAAAGALLAAWLGAGYWALVLQQVLLSAVSLAGAWITCPWRPGRPVRGSGVRPLLRFGGNLTGFGIANYLARNLDDVLIGRQFGPGPLGLYSKAYGLLLMPLRQINTPLSHIAIPTLSRLQDQPERYCRYYLGSLGLVALITMPLIAWLFVVSREVVLFILGPQWIGASALFSIMAVTAFLQPVLHTAGWVYVSLGQADRMARWGTLFSGLHIASFVVGLPWGPEGVAVSYAVSVYLLAVPGLWAAYRRSPVGLRAAARAVSRPAKLGLVVGGAAGLARHGLGVSHAPAVVLLVSSAAAAAAAATLIAAWPGLRQEVRTLGALLADLRRGAP